MRRDGSWVALILLGLCLAAVFFALPGCATVQSAPQQPVPGDFLAECRALEREIRTNGDLAKALLDHKEALKLCNNDKQAIREWSDALSKEK